MKFKNILKLVFSILLCQGAGFLGSLATRPAIGGWYAGLVKPAFSPPNWIFVPVWTLLYFLMGASLFLVLKTKAKERQQRALFLFFIQLILNISWSVIFFNLKAPLTAFIEIIALWYFIFLTTKAFLRISRLAGFLMIPYLLWVSFAAFLNFSIFWLNR